MILLEPFVARARSEAFKHHRFLNLPFADSCIWVIDSTSNCGFGVLLQTVSYDRSNVPVYQRSLWASLLYQLMDSNVGRLLAQSLGVHEILRKGMPNQQWRSQESKTHNLWKIPFFLYFCRGKTLVQKNRRARAGEMKAYSEQSRQTTPSR